jgi:hypothetical protein
VEETDVEQIDGLDPRDPELRKRSDAALAKIVGRNGELPTLAHYRRVYDTQGLPWPGDDRIREMYPVAL